MAVELVLTYLMSVFFFSRPVFAVQELVDFEHIQGIEWSQESEDEDETVEGMELAE